MADAENTCPWCGEVLYNPFTGKEAPAPGDRIGEYDLALEAHAPECESMDEGAFLEMWP